MRAEVVVELRSPDDETYAKLDWYARLGVGQVLVVDVATRRAEHPQPPHCHRRMGPAQSFSPGNDERDAAGAAPLCRA
jgi:Uma2 family endonuclease